MGALTKAGDAGRTLGSARFSGRTDLIAMEVIKIAIVVLLPTRLSGRRFRPERIEVSDETVS